MSDSDMPLRAEFGRPQLDRNAMEDVPKDLQGINFLPTPEPYNHVTLDRAALDNVSTEPMQPYLPPWVAVSRRPQLVTFPGQPKRKILHRGIELDPLYIWGPDDRRFYNDKRYPWGCVCRVLTPILTGSGVIVGPRHVLTASHLIDWNRVGGMVEVHRAGLVVSAFSAISAGTVLHQSPGPRME